MPYTVDPLDTSFSQVSGYDAPIALEVDFVWPEDGSNSPLGISSAIAVAMLSAIAETTLSPLGTSVAAATAYPTALASSSLTPLGASTAAAYAPAATTLYGRAITIAGDAITTVAIYNHTTHELAYLVTPDHSGRWYTEATAGSYDILYLSDGCQSICHGPYTVS